MSDPIGMFFDELAARGHEPLLAKVKCSLRVDAVGGARTRRWLLTVRDGTIEVSRRSARADLVIRGERTLLERIVRGKANAMAAVLRGELSVQGNAEILAQFQRLFPRPRDAATKGVAAGYATRRP